MAMTSAERNRQRRIRQGKNVNPPGVRGRPRTYLVTLEAQEADKIRRKEYHRKYYLEVLKARRQQQRRRPDEGSS